MGYRPGAQDVRERASICQPCNAAAEIGSRLSANRMAEHVQRDAYRPASNLTPVRVTPCKPLRVDRSRLFLPCFESDSLPHGVPTERFDEGSDAPAQPAEDAIGAVGDP